MLRASYSKPVRGQRLARRADGVVEANSGQNGRFRRPAAV